MKEGKDTPVSTTLEGWGRAQIKTPVSNKINKVNKAVTFSKTLFNQTPLEDGGKDLYKLSFELICF